ncbi:NADH-ubiquinone oxidoreductase-F iron-sulfur binding region domain-containing protein [Streptomyces sp. NPDC052042]|uniref:NADH-ubiquinone oxidoreductase-F iron-sulfur binding region domain-containing protein n=1 Tax=Streptomyces sp. NPDC052042 TaxID=3365683 RepID=UPI0037CCE762
MTTAPPDPATELLPVAHVHPGTPVRLLSTAPEPAVAVRGSALIEELAASGLRGRGGAAFSVATKWRGVAAGPGPRVVVANGAEGEPASWKDRYLLRTRPHLVLDGLLLAAEALNANRAIVYVTRPEDEQAVRTALAGRSGSAVEIVTAADRYVAGEETAVVRAIDEGIALPRAKPPRPYEKGVDGRPTLIQNIESLAHAAWIARHGAEAFREVGTPGSPGTTLITVNAGERTTLFEVALGTPLRDIVGEAGAVLAGGYFGGLLPASRLDLPLDYDAFRAAGSGLGCAAFTVLQTGQCPLELGTAVAGYFAAESSRQCGVCLNGTKAMAAALERVRTGEHSEDDLDKLARWATTLPGRGACALLDGAALLVRSLLEHFADEIRYHLRRTCPAREEHQP